MFMDKSLALDISRRLFSYAIDLSIHTQAKALLIYADVFDTPEAFRNIARENCGVPLILVTDDPETFYQCSNDGCSILAVPRIRLDRPAQIHMAVLLGFAKGVFDHGDQLVCTTGAPGSNLLDLILYTEPASELGAFGVSIHEKISEEIMSEVFERILAIAIELGNEGREGKPVGTIFVIGDLENVMKNSEQMIFNPFHGYPAEERNVLDPRLKETIKEFAMIDGAFLISGTGFVESAGAYLRSNVPPEMLARGLGTRHQSAAGITAATGAVAVVVSQSTGNITVYHQGKKLIEIEKADVADRMARGKE